LNGQMLTPVAHRSDPIPRTAEKVFHTRIEGAFQKIIRHGNAPSNYWWEVVEKNGLRHFYGGDPDLNNNAGGIVTNAVMGTGGSGGDIFKWSLRETRDRFDNKIIYTYSRVSDTGFAFSAEMGYSHTIQKITYTGHGATAGKYTVEFKTDHAMSPAEPRRPDVRVNARGGYKDVMLELLRTITVKYDTQIIREYEFTYTTGAFKKTLLTSIIKRDKDKNDPTVQIIDTHTMEYFDEVRDPTTGLYTLMSPPFAVPNAGPDGVFDPVMQPFFQAGGVDASASEIGGTYSQNFGMDFFSGLSTGPGAVNEPSPGAKVGVNYKTNATGYKIGYSMGFSFGASMLIDMNGDGLPDKLFRHPLTGVVGIRYMQLVNGTPVFSGPVPIPLPMLSMDMSVDMSKGPENYNTIPAATISNTGFNQGMMFISDINSDGLPDFVVAGNVLFNHVQNGVVTLFSPDSNGTPVPIQRSIPASQAASDNFPDLSSVKAAQESTFPLIDAVRYWTAPHAGTVAITGDATLIDPATCSVLPAGVDLSTLDAATKASIEASMGKGNVDGVNVTIQHNGSELWRQNILPGDTTAHTPALSSVAVQKGDRIYFRVNSIGNGYCDQVTWDPTITYAGSPTPSIVDANNHDPYIYSASGDFLIAGRSREQIVPYTGTLHLEGDLSKTAVVSDDLRIVVYKNGQSAFTQNIARDTTGAIPVATNLQVTAQDKIAIALKSDSPIDHTKLSWNPGLYYTATSDPGITLQDPSGNYILRLGLVPSRDLYPESDLTAIQQAYQATQNGSKTFYNLVTFKNGVTPPDGKITATIKSEGVQSAKSTLTVQGGALTGDATATASLTQNKRYYFDFTTEDPDIAAAIESHRVIGVTDTPVAAMVFALQAPGPGPENGQAVHTVSVSDTHIVQGSFTATAGSNGTVQFTVNRNGSVIAETTFTVTNGVVGGGSDLVINPTQGDGLYFNLIASSSALASAITTPVAIVKVPEATTYPSALHYKTKKQSTIKGIFFSDPARGWSYFGYNASVGTSTGAMSEAAFDAAIGANFDITTSPVAGLIPDPAANRWKGITDLIYLEGGAASASRNGVADIAVPTLADVTAPPANTQIGYARVLPRFSLNDGTSNSAAGGRKSTSTSKTVLDTRDVNGDGFPDVVFGPAALVTTPYGSVGGSVSVIPQATISEMKSETTSLSIVDVFASARSAYKKIFAGGKLEKASKLSYGLNGTLGTSKSHSSNDLIDMNGDGLPDVVTNPLGNGAALFSLNKGDSRWGAIETLTFPIHLNESEGSSQTVGASLGFNDGNYGFSGGISIDSNTEERKESLFRDINGDGLPDLITPVPGGFLVAYNTGTSFEAIGVAGGTLDNGNKVTSSSYNYGVGGSAEIPIPLPIPTFAIVLNPGTSIGKSMSRTESTLMDINGDGFLDHLSSSGDGTLKASVSQVGKTNLLKKVNRPFNTSLTLDYNRVGNTFDMPQSRWVMASVNETDGFAGDGGDLQKRTFSYANGKYNRNERDFYGFATVTENELDTQNGNAVYRKTIRTYYNDTYYKKGLLVSEEMRDGQNNPWLKTVNTYAYRDGITGATVTDLSSTIATIFPAVIKTAKFFYEGNAATQKRTYETFDYDVYGNVTSYLNAGERDTVSFLETDDDVEATITYSTDTNLYIVGKPTSILVKKAADGATMRKREADYSATTGALMQVRVFTVSGTQSVTGLTYDGYGNLETVTGPANHAGERSVLTYSYDGLTHSYVTGIAQSYGPTISYTSSATYNYLFGQVEETTDVNGNKTRYVYDELGRPIKFHGPHQPYVDKDSQATIKFEYHPEATVPYARTDHYTRFDDGNYRPDPTQPESIVTVLFTDGLGRVLQTKKSASLFTGIANTAAPVTTVSGRVTFDTFGRTIKQRYPVHEAPGTEGTFNATEDPVAQTLTSYDVLDRVTKVETPYEKITDQSGNVSYTYRSTTMSYGIGTDRNGDTMFKTTVTDPLNNVKSSYKTVDDAITSIAEEHTPSGGTKQILWTSYQYDVLNQITEVKDANSNVTTITYDNLGRRTSIGNPDTGKTEMQYDAAGNMIAKITANLKEHNKQITYAYDYDRLKSITYPDNPQNNVTYTYGAPGAANNTAGRIVTVTDGSGSLTKEYGMLGETTKETRTVNTNPTPATYTTQYEWDSFGRMQRNSHVSLRWRGIAEADQRNESGNRRRLRDATRI